MAEKEKERNHYLLSDPSQAKLMDPNDPLEAEFHVSEYLDEGLCSSSTRLMVWPTHLCEEIHFAFNFYPLIQHLAL